MYVITKCKSHYKSIKTDFSTAAQSFAIGKAIIPLKLKVTSRGVLKT